jgi:hypothetical protein
MRAYTRPMRVAGLGGPEERCLAFEAMPLRAGSDGLFTEQWLQMLIQRQPYLSAMADYLAALETATAPEMA